MYCCYSWLYPRTPCCPLQYNQNILYLVAIFDSTHIHKASYSVLQRLGNNAQEKTIADILIEDKLWPPLDMVTADQEWENHKSNTWTKHKAFIVVRLVNRSYVLTTSLSLVYFFTGSRNGVVVDVYWNIRSLLVLKLRWQDILQASYVNKEEEKPWWRSTCLSAVVFARPIHYLREVFKAC